jgi:glycosyltransferase involved in cell wall biosynthesis
MKILYVGTLPPHNGGSAVLAYELLKGLAKRGHKVDAISPITKKALESGDKFAKVNKYIVIKRYIVSYFENSPDKPPSDQYRNIEGEQVRKEVLNILSIENPDIIIIGRETFAWYVPDIANEYSIPTVLLIQGATTFGILKQTIPNEMSRNLLKQFQKVDSLIVVARHLKNNLIQLGFKNIKIIENTIDTGKFTPGNRDNGLLRKLKIEDNSVVITHISNLKPLKRPFDIICAASHALKKKSKVVFIVVGEGPLRSEMEEKCKSENIYDKFRFVDWVEYNKVPDFIRIADIVVMPSEAEARALVYLETQACGRLLLASDIPAAKEVIDDMETGLLFRKGDIDDLTRKLLFAANHPQFRNQVGIKARESVEKHSLSEFISEYELTFREVINYNHLGI